jgi:hypothetical protein
MKLNEEKTVSLMVELYCRKNHGRDGILCSTCKSLLEYALHKLATCPLQPNKPVCSNCKIHCYIPEQRDHIRKVMRFSGPRMMFRHPVIGMNYMIKKKLHT